MTKQPSGHTQIYKYLNICISDQIWPAETAKILITTLQLYLTVQSSHFSHDFKARITNFFSKLSVYSPAGWLHAHTNTDRDTIALTESAVGACCPAWLSYLHFNFLTLGSWSTTHKCWYYTRLPPQVLRWFALPFHQQGYHSVCAHVEAAATLDQSADRVSAGTWKTTSDRLKKKRTELILTKMLQVTEKS